MNSVSRRAITVLSIACAVFLSACNSGGDGEAVEPTPTSTATPTASPSAEPTPTPTATPTATATATATPSATPAPTLTPTALGHPRLWLTASDLPRLRSLAVGGNPYWEDGLELAAERAVNDMDEGRVAEDCGDVGYTEYPTESYAAFFGFLSLVAPEAQRAGYAQRARTLLMTIINEADKGPAPARNFNCDGNQQYPRFRHPDFATEDRDRARYHGEAFGLTVDWIYPSLSGADRAAIRRVFLRWSSEIVNRGYRHPEPVGLLNDPSLYADKYQRRFAANNYYGAHMRNLALMALALDAGDDAGGQLRAYLNTATGAYFYIFRELVRIDSAGGLLPEGFEYSPQTAAYHLQFLLALNTAGAGGDDARAIDTMPFWSDFVTAYFHSLSPAAVVREESRGAEYLPAFYGDAQEYQLPDFVNSFAPLGIHDRRNGGNPARLNAARWAVLNTPVGGAAEVMRRISNPADLREAILYFMVLDPAVTPTDPRPGLATRYYASGPARMFARSGWNADASWFTYALSWNSIDHQNAEGNSFAMFRKGEWLTKTTLGYADIGESIASTEYANGLCIENDRPDRDDSDYRIDLWRRGSQWYLGSDDAPVVRARSFGADYAYALGDATTLYNSTNESSTDVLLANRSIVWLQSDRVFVYDRAQTRSANRFKRFWLQLPNPATISGNRATARTDGGQSLGVTSVLPSGAVLASVTGDAYDPDIERKIANNEPMTARLSITAPGNPQTARFLTVLQGADSNAQLQAVSGFASGDNAWQGAAVGSDAAIFPATVGNAGAFTLTLPAGASRVLITGLTPNAGYTVTRSGNTLTLAVGGTATADSGGVLQLR